MSPIRVMNHDSDWDSLAKFKSAPVTVHDRTGPGAASAKFTDRSHRTVMTRFMMPGLPDRNRAAGRPPSGPPWRPGRHGHDNTWILANVRCHTSDVRHCASGWTTTCTYDIVERQTNRFIDCSMKADILLGGNGAVRAIVVPRPSTPTG
jgi:hypothetical protein